MAPAGRFQGHRSWAYWNVSLWVGNDERLYKMACNYIGTCPNKRDAAERMMGNLQIEQNTQHPQTPDGAYFSKDKLYAAMRGMTAHG